MFVQVFHEVMGVHWKMSPSSAHILGGTQVFIQPNDSVRSETQFRDLNGNKRLNRTQDTVYCWLPSCKYVGLALKP